MKNMQIKYPNTLKEHRLRMNLTQKDVATYLNFTSVERICRWEQGQAVPGIYNLFKLAKLYNIRPENFYTNTFE